MIDGEVIDMQRQWLSKPSVTCMIESIWSRCVDTHTHTHKAHTGTYTVHVQFSHRREQHPIYRSANHHHPIPHPPSLLPFLPGKFPFKNSQRYKFWFAWCLLYVRNWFQSWEFYFDGIRLKAWLLFSLCEDVRYQVMHLFSIILSIFFFLLLILLPNRNRIEVDRYFAFNQKWNTNSSGGGSFGCFWEMKVLWYICSSKWYKVEDVYIIWFANEWHANQLIDDLLI